MTSELGNGSYEEKLRELGLLSLEDRRVAADMIQVYKILHRKDKVKGIFELTSSGPVSTRAASDPLFIKIARSRLDIMKYFFTNRALEKWNLLPLEMRQAPTVEKFKEMYKNHMRTPDDVGS